MVIEAVSELNGQPPPELEEIKLDLPFDAHLPTDYVQAEPQRLEAYRKLAAVQQEAEVDAIRDEWVDRYGPVPDAAERLLEVAQLRAHCARLGVTELVVVKGPGFGGPEFVAKLGPVEMKVSQEVRFTRLFPSGVWKAKEFGERGGQLQVGLKKKATLATDLVTFFETLFPIEEMAEAAS